MGRKKPTARDDDNMPTASQGGGKSKKKGLVIDDDEYSIGTELSEEPLAQEEKPAATGKKKGEKGNSKASKAEDEDLEKAMEDNDDDDDDVPEVVFTGKKKGKSKKGGNSAFTGSSFGLLGDEEGGEDDDEDKQSGLTGGLDNHDDEVLSFSGKKFSKGSKKKGGSLFIASAFDAIDEDDEGEVIDNSMKASPEENDDMDEPVIAFTGKKKSSKSSKKASALFTASSFGDTEGDQDKNEQEDGDEDVALITFSGKKKKSSKSSKKAVNSFSAAFAEEDVDDDDSVLDSSRADEEKAEDEDVSVVFSGKKKSSKKNKTATIKASDDFESANEEQLSVIDNNKGNKSEEVIENSKNKKKKNKKSGRTAQEEEDLDKLLAELGEGPPVKSASPPAEDDKVQASSEVAAPAIAVVKKVGEEETMESAAAKKKKNKKSGRTAQEEEDLDKLLAELGEGPPVKSAFPLAEDDKVQASSEVAAPATAVVDKDGEEETMESAAAKKKKKKKEKEKEKKAAVAAAAASAPDHGKKEEVKPDTSESKKSDSKTKAADKKVPKHVREMQEALARRKEAEERKKREEEERLRKEEEERRRQEELERQAEEARRRKKEREKEKLQKKKQEGKLLTGKQKEEARRLEAMRKQFLSGTGGVTLPTGDSGAPAKRPIYKTKKSKQTHHHQNDTAPVKADEDVEAKENLAITRDAESLEPEKVEVVESVQDEDKVKPSEDVQEAEVEEDNEDEWDAKSWDDVNLNGKGAFADEEADSEPEPVVKKEIKNAAPPAAVKSTGTTKKAASQPPTEQIESKKQVEKQPPKPDGHLPSNSAVPSQPSGENLRSPICCIMGHVDAGKTKLLDCIRRTNVQEGEAGGITQQIGATYFPAENIRERTKELKADAKLKVPGLLVIDTPGHESFTNLRSRGSGLCDIAILVVDIMHGLQPQTIESLNLLKMRNTEFIVALNKVDRLYGWRACTNSPIVKAMKQQTKDVQNEFNMRVTQTITQFKEQGLNTELYYKNKEMGETFSIVPTSATSGEGIPDLLLLLVQWTQKTMAQQLTYSDEVQCTVLEVKVVEGHGTTIDVVLVNGVLHEGEQIVVCGMQGPIVTTIRALLTPHPMKELRVKGTYLHHKEIKAAMGIKITAQGLEHAIAGTALHVVKPDDDLEEVKEAAMEDMETVMRRIDKSGEGVCVQASTLGSLEALLEFLKTPEVNIPVSGISIGPVHKKDVMKASVMLEKKREFATILAFDVKVNQEAKDLAEELGVKIFMADIIYHLFDQFKAYIDNIKEEKKKEAAEEAVFPCVLKILPRCIFNKKDPIVLGVDILEGVLKVGTPICIPSRDYIDIGRIASIENNKKPVDYAKKGQQVAIKIVGSNSEEQQKMYGRHFEIDDELVSHITRRSIDILKTNYRDELTMEEWRLVAKLKNVFRIQ